MTRTALLSIAAAAVFSAASPASAAIMTYDVASTPVVNCKGSPHGLWTNRHFGGHCGNYFDFQKGSTFTLDTDDNTGHFLATAINPQGKTAIIDIRLGGFLETTDGTPYIYKREGGPAYDPKNDTPDIDFFARGRGTITIDGMVYHLNMYDPFTGRTLFQFGGDDMIGANAKNNDFGGSAWINMWNRQYGRLRHWDLNFNLAKRVPEPAMLGLLGLGLAGIGMSRRRRRKAA